MFYKSEYYEMSRNSDKILCEYDICSGRDFTINAIAWSPKTGLIDLHGGVKDIKNRLITAVKKENLIYVCKDNQGIQDIRGGIACD